MAEKSIEQFDEKNDGQIHVSVREILGSCAAARDSLVDL